MISLVITASFEFIVTPPQRPGKESQIVGKNEVWPALSKYATQKAGVLTIDAGLGKSKSQEEY
jgi:hypothetical protein